MKKAGSKGVLFRAEETDVQVLQVLRDRWGLNSDAAAIRFAIRVAARLGDDLIRSLLRPNNHNQMEVER